MLKLEDSRVFYQLGLDPVRQKIYPRIPSYSALPDQHYIKCNWRRASLGVTSSFSFPQNS